MVNKLKIKCIQCGIMMETFHSNKKFCSDNCNRLFYKKVRAKKITYKITICKYCQKEYNKPSSTPKRVYCSDECANNHNKEYFEKLKNGIVEYTDGTSGNYYRLRFEVLKRDNFTCQYCGKNVIDDKIKIHIDHIHPESKGGKFEIDNLITSCEECNLGKLDVLLTERILNKLKQYTISDMKGGYRNGR